jgi:hypothetical protein
MKTAVAEEIARRARCGGEGGGEDEEAAREGGEDALREDGDGRDCAMTECALQRWDGVEDDDESDDEDDAMVDEDYAAEHNYLVY